MPTKRKVKPLDIDIDLRLIKAIAHPHRFQALHILNQREASPSELANEIGTPVGKLAYHVRELEKFDCIELVRTVPRRGATEHFYRAVRSAYFNDKEWVRLPESVRGSIVGMQMKATGELVGESMRAGIFERREDRHHSLHTMKVDVQGWSETTAVLEETMKKLIEIKATSTERLLEGSEDSIPMAVSIIGFETAP